MAKTRSKMAIVLLATLGITLIIIGGSIMILTLGSLLFALLGITEVDLAETAGSSVDPVPVWGGFLIGAVIGFMVLFGGIGIFVERKGRTTGTKQKIPEFPKF
ncbi:MAG: hypothetical protein ABIP50_01690 [Candidatus Saccharimonadales bacterium]